jgi:hypothetical protein
MLRQFAVLWIAFFGLGAVWQGFVQHRPITAALLAVLAIGVGSIGLIRPQLVRPIFVTWMVLVFPIGWLVSNIVLAVVFFGMITPIGILFRLLGRDPLARKPQPDRSSYWTEKPMPSDPRRYFRQF